MTEIEINSIGKCDHRRYYDLNHDVYDCLTVNLKDGTITIHGQHSIERLLQDALAIERDRLLGYQVSDLHKPPADFVQQTWEQLVALGYDPDELIVPAEQSTLEAHNGVTRPD